MFRILLPILFLFGIKCYALDAHYAEYMLSLHESTVGSDIYEVEGKSVYKLKKECSGWNASEELLVFFKTKNNGQSKLESKWKTFETFSGEAYQFDLIDKINDERSNNFFGFANITSENNNAKYFSDKEYTVPLETLIEFPVTQLKNIILAAENNEKIYNSNIFMGSELLDGHRVVTVIIGKQKKYKENIFENELYEKLYWPINLAYYNPELELEKPEYRISAKLQKNGVLIEYIIFYDNFSIISKLSNIEQIDDTNCVDSN